MALQRVACSPAVPAAARITASERRGVQSSQTSCPEIILLLTRQHKAAPRVGDGPWKAPSVCVGRPVSFPFRWRAAWKVDAAYWMCPFPAAWFYSAPHAFILSSGIFPPLWWHPHILAIYLLHTHDFFS